MPSAIGPSVSFACPACRKKFNAPGSLAGREVKCSGCGGAVTIPSVGGVTQSSVSSPVSPSPTAVWQTPGPRAATPAQRPGGSAPPTPATSTDVTWRPSASSPSGSALASSSTPTAGAQALSRSRSPTGQGRPATWGTAVGVMAVVLLIGGLVAAGSRVRNFDRHAAQPGADVVPAASSVPPGRVIRPSDVDGVINSVRINEMSSKNVYQQMVSYARGTMEMAALVTLAVGAPAAEVASTKRAAEIAEMGAKTVHQQKAVYLEGTMSLLALAARASGASATDVGSILSQVRVNEMGMDTVHQQNANYCDGALLFAELIARSAGASGADAAAIMAEARAADMGARNVNHQIVGRLTGFVRMLGLAAKARGLSTAAVQGILSDMRAADISADTVFQQEVTRLAASLRLLGLIAAGQ